MKISVVIPMYNEASVIGSSAQTLDAALMRDFGDEEYEVIFVSDGSSDGCDRIIEEYSKTHSHIKLIAYTPNHGKGYAVRTGMLAANGDFVLFTDSDLAYGADIIKTVYDCWKENNADLVIGSRAMKGGGYDSYTFLRKVMSKTYLKFINIVAGFKHSDSQAGLKGFSNSVAKKIFSNCIVDRFAFDLEAIMFADKLGCKVVEIPAKVITHSESKVNPIKDALNMVSQIKKIKKHVRSTQL